MKKNIRDYKKVGVQYAYVLDAICFEGTDKEKVSYFFDSFNAERNSVYDKRCYPNLTDRVANYIQGLPNCIDVAFCDYYIAETGKLWGYCKTDKQAAKFVDNWFNMIALRLIQLKKYYNI